MVNERERCASIREEFSALLDGELTLDERDRVESHLAECSDCLRELDGFKKVDVMFRRLPSVDAPPEVEARIRAALRPTLLRILRPYNRAVRRALWPAMAAGVLLSATSAWIWFYGPNVQQELAVEQMAAATYDRDDSQASLAAKPLGDSAPAAESTAPTDTLAQSVPAAGAMLMRDEYASESRRADNSQQSELDAEKKEDGVDLGIEVGESSAAPVQMETRRARLSAEPPTTPAAPPTEAPAPHVMADPNPARQPAAAQSEAALSDALAKTISAPRTFAEENGVWYESGYRGETLTDIKRDSDQFRELIANDPHLRDALASHERAIFRVGGAWYRVGPS